MILEIPMLHRYCYVCRVEAKTIQFNEAHVVNLGYNLSIDEFLEYLITA